MIAPTTHAIMSEAVAAPRSRARGTSYSMCDQRLVVRGGDHGVPTSSVSWRVGNEETPRDTAQQLPDKEDREGVVKDRDEDEEFINSYR